MYIEDLLRDLRNRGLSENTIRNHRTHLKRFIEYCAHQEIHDPRQLSDETVRRYMKDVLDPLPHSPTWKYSSTCCLRTYFRWLAENSKLFAPPAIHMNKPRCPSRSHRPIGLMSLRVMLDHIPTDTDSDVLLKAIIELGYSLALRSGELRRLTIEQIDFSSGVLFIEQSKGRKDRIVPVGKIALEWMRTYITDIRPRYCRNPDERTVFLGIRTKSPLSSRTFSQFVHDRLVRNKLSAISPHQLRASAATHLVSRGMDIAYVQQLLGHTELRTTQVYVQIQAIELEQRLKKSHPRNGMKIGRK